MKRATYEEVRDMMGQGDLIAFGGEGIISRVIKRITKCNVSHVGAILQTGVPTVEGLKVNQIIESTSLGDGFAGVQINRLSDRVQFYDGEVFLYPLKFKLWERCELSEYIKFMLKQRGKKYDASQAVLSAMDKIPDTSEDFSRLFCSELVTGAYKAGRLLNHYLNSSETTPADLVNMPIYDEPVRMV